MTDVVKNRGNLISPEQLESHLQFLFQAFQSSSKNFVSNTAVLPSISKAVTITIRLFLRPENISDLLSNPAIIQLKALYDEPLLSKKCIALYCMSQLLIQAKEPFIYQSTPERFQFRTQFSKQVIPQFLNEAYQAFMPLSEVEVDVDIKLLHNYC